MDSPRGENGNTTLQGLLQGDVKSCETATESPRDDSSGGKEVQENQFSEIEIDHGEESSREGEDAAVSGGESHGGYDGDEKINGDAGTIVQPHTMLPRPEPPPGLTQSTSSPPQSSGVVLPIQKLSAAIAKRLSSLKQSENGENDDVVERKPEGVTEINLSGIKVIAKPKEEEDELKGRISFFSRSNCRDSTAVRRFFREKGLKYVEINIDVYPHREKELVRRTGSLQVPQIFFNEKLFGGLLELNSLRNSGGFKEKLNELVGNSCSDDAPAPPVYGFDEPKDESPDELVGIIRVLRQRIPIQDRLMRMKIVRNCFAGAEMVELLMSLLDCARTQAVEIGKQLVRKHFVHHVFAENDFEDGNHFYRFLEHEAFIPKCSNFQGSTNDCEPKPVVLIGQRLAKIMFAMVESFASNDGSSTNYAGISKSEEFRRYLNLTQELHRVNLLVLLQDEKLAFFLNLYNAMVIHAVIRAGCPKVIDRNFFSDFCYVIGGYPYSLTTIKNGILRSNCRPPYSLVKPFGNGDKRLELIVPKVNPLIHFGLCDGTKSSPKVRFFTSEGVQAELRCATREFFQSDGIEIDLEKRIVYLTHIIKWFDADFGREKEVLKWILTYLDTTKAGLLMHLLSDGGAVRIVYQDYDWSVNS